MALNSSDPSEGFVLDLISNPDTTGQSRTKLENDVYTYEQSGFFISVTPLYRAHGTLTPGGDAASLLAYKFKLYKSGKVHNANRRFKALVVNLRFEQDPVDKPEFDPYIECFAPTQEGDGYTGSTNVARDTESSNEMTAAIKDKLDLGYKHGSKNKSEWVQTRKVKLRSRAFKATGGGRKGKNCVEWTIEENDAEPEIPDTFVVGVVLAHPKRAPFKVVFDIHVRVDFWFAVDKTWRQMKDKFGEGIHLFDGKNLDRQNFAVYPFDTASDGELPPGTESTKLGVLVEGTNLDDKVYVHMPEELQLKKFYIKGQEDGTNARGKETKKPGTRAANQGQDATNQKDDAKVEMQDGKVELEDGKVDVEDESARDQAEEDAEEEDVTGE